MEFNTEEIIAIIGIVIAVLIAMTTLILQYYPRYKRAFKHLKLIFYSTKSLSDEIKSLLNEMITKYNIENEIFFENISYKAYLTVLEEMGKKDLSDDVINNLEKTFKESNKIKLPIKETIQSMVESITQQNNALVVVRNNLLTKRIIFEGFLK